MVKWKESFRCSRNSSTDVEYNGVTYVIGQTNNALIYPDLDWNACFRSGLLTDEMIGAAAHALSGIVDITDRARPCYLHSNMWQRCHLKVAAAVAKKLKNRSSTRSFRPKIWKKAVRD